MNNLYVHQSGSIDRFQTSIITPDQSGPGSNGNEEVVYTAEISKPGVSSSDETPGLDTLSGGVLPFCRVYNECLQHPTDRVRRKIEEEFALLWTVLCQSISVYSHVTHFFLF